MSTSFVVRKSKPLQGEVAVLGAKNSVLVSIASLLLAPGKSVLYNVPASNDVQNICRLLTSLGAIVFFDEMEHKLEVDCTTISFTQIDPVMMSKMRASVLVAGPLLARLQKSQLSVPGGCAIGPRPIDFHLKGFAKLGLGISEEGELVNITGKPQPATIVLEYPSVGATENLMMAAVLSEGTTTIIDAAVEPEVLDLAQLLNKMGARIEVQAPATIVIHGVQQLKPVEHEIMPDRLEAGSILLAAAITGGTVKVTNAYARDLDVFLLKLKEMGHELEYERHTPGITIKATSTPKAVSFKTGPFPGFPTDLQSPFMAALTLAEGESTVVETVFENRMHHVAELVKMGADITVDGSTAKIRGVKKLVGTTVAGSDIRAACALVLAGMAAEGQTIVENTQYWRRGYDKLEVRLNALGAEIEDAPIIVAPHMEVAVAAVQ